MNVSDLKLLKSPLFILKKMQKDTAQKNNGYIRGRILDVGCGQSPYRELFPDCRFVGVDSMPGMNVSLIGDAVNLPLKDSVLDGAIATEVIEHVALPEDLIRELSRVVKRNGFFYITAPMTWCLHYEPNDYYRFTRFGLEFLLKRNGLETVAVTRIGGIGSMVSVRLIDVCYEIIQRGLFFLRPKWREKIGLLCVMPFSLIFYYLSRLIDRIDKRDALGWAILARKVG